jgi:lysosomal alpha-mannosidase
LTQLNELKDDPLKPYPWTVHVVPHSHDDVGWLKTLDEYFDGQRKDIQFTNVRVELTTVVQALLDDSTRRFSEVEMAFFKKWYDLQSDDMRQKVKGLINSG